MIHAIIIYSGEWETEKLLLKYLEVPKDEIDVCETISIKTWEKESWWLLGWQGIEREQSWSQQKQ